MASSNLNAKQQESRTFEHRLWLSLVIIVVVFSVLIGRLVYLQVIEHGKYVSESDSNRYQLQSVAPKRGLIFDTNGVLIAGNRAVHNLVIVPEMVPGGRKNIDATLVKLHDLLTIDDHDVARFKRRLGQARRPYTSIPLKYELSEEEIAQVTVNQHAYTGVSIQADLVRNYPFDDGFVHALGYVGRINDRELKTLDEVDYSGTNHIGKLGVEKKYEDILHGTVGHQTVETNVRGRIMRVVDRVDPIPGQDISLYLDARLQQKAVKLLQGKRGALVALDPDTGGVLAIVSAPSYSANQFVTGISSNNYKALRESNDLPLFNRALRGRYPPASTVKPVIALAGIDTGIISRNYQIKDPGFYQLTEGGRLYRDWKPEGHGIVGLHKSIVESVDTYYYDIGYRMGNEPMTSYLGKFGLGRVTIADQPEAISGILPTKDWKQSVRNAPWFPGDSLNLSIGQGFLSATPVQLAAMTMVLANRGKWQQIRMIKSVGDRDISKISEVGYKDSALPADVVLKNDKDWDRMHKAMIGVMHGGLGTGRASGAGSTYLIAGKTGTAQVKGIKQAETYDEEATAERLRDHGLFVGWAPAKDPRIVVAVVVENGGSGSRAAAPLARQLMDTYLLSEPNEEAASE